MDEIQELMEIIATPYREPEVKEQEETNGIKYTKGNPYSEKLKQLNFPRTKIEESVLIVAPSGTGKTLWLQWVKYTLKFNGIEFVEFNETEFETNLRDWAYDIQKDVNYYLSKPYLLMDQLFNAIERICEYKKGWGFYEYLIDRLYQNSISGKKIVIAVTNRDVLGDTTIPLNIPEDSTRKLKEIFKRRIVL